MSKITDLETRIKELEKENQELKAKIHDIFFGPPDAIITVESGDK
jgi:cell division protein FtsL